MNYLRNKRRSRMDPETIEALMRIRLNAPRNIRKFKAVDCAKQWAKDGHRLVDSSHNRKRKTSEEDIESTDIHSLPEIFSFMDPKY